MLAGGCNLFSRGPKPVDPASPAYRDIVSAFYTGLAALQALDDGRAVKELQQATKLAPQEPAAWANLGIVQLRLSNFEAASASFEKAHELMPDNSRIELSRALLKSNQGKIDEAVALLRRAIELDPKNIRARYVLTQQIERQSSSNTQAPGNTEIDKAIGAQLEEILKVQPDNVLAIVDAMRLDARRGDIAGIGTRLGQFQQLAHNLPPGARTELQAVQAALGARSEGLASAISRLKNSLGEWPAYQQSAAELQTSDREGPEPFEQFLVLTSPTPQAAPPDEKLTFTAGPLPGADKAAWIGVVTLSSEASPRPISSDGKTAQSDQTVLSFPGGAKVTPPGVHGIVGLDWNYDFKTDLAFAGAGGLRLWQQGAGAKFTDVTARTTLPQAILKGAYTGAWDFDIEADGDLDLVLSPASGPPLVLRNNGGESGEARTFREIRPFPGIGSLRDFTKGDFDADGDADAALVDKAGKLFLFSNERGGFFKAVKLPNSSGQIVALALADVDGDSVLDVLMLNADGVLKRLAYAPDKNEWMEAEVLRRATKSSPEETERVLVGDLDNNGQIDIVISNKLSTQIWQGSGPLQYKALDSTVGAGVFALADIDKNGQLDLGRLSRPISRNCRSARAPKSITGRCYGHSPSRRTATLASIHSVSAARSSFAPAYSCRSSR